MVGGGLHPPDPVSHPQPHKDQTIMRSSSHHGGFWQTTFGLPAPSVRSLQSTVGSSVVSVGYDRPAVVVWCFWNWIDTSRGDVHFADTKDPCEKPTPFSGLTKTKRPFSGPPMFYEKILSISNPRHVQHQSLFFAENI
jgi:hypothetical protein